MHSVFEKKYLFKMSRKGKDIKVQKTTLDNFFTRTDHAIPVVPKIKPEVDANESFYEICVSDEINLMNNEESNGGPHDFDVQELVCSVMYEANEHENATIEIEENTNQPPSSKCTNEKCVSQVCILS